MEKGKKEERGEEMFEVKGGRVKKWTRYIKYGFFSPNLNHHHHCHYHYHHLHHLHHHHRWSGKGQKVDQISSMHTTFIYFLFLSTTISSSIHLYHTCVSITMTRGRWVQIKDISRISLWSTLTPNVTTRRRRTRTSTSKSTVQLSRRHAYLLHHHRQWHQGWKWFFFSSE